MTTLLKFTVTDKDAGRKYCDILRSELNISAGEKKKMKQNPNSFKVNGTPAFATARAKVGDVLEIALFDEGCSQTITPKAGEFEIIYEDDFLFVINKPPHTPTIPSQNHREDSLGNFLMYEMQKRGENFVFRPVNRLDAHTSGVMLVAKSAYAHNILVGQIKKGTLNREYLAIATGIIDNDGFIDAPIAREEGSAIKRRVDAGGKFAKTHYRVVKKGDNHTLLALKLETGRTHQIRVHLAHIRHPLLGDFLYGETSPLIDRVALHSALVTFLHPKTKEQMKFEASYPEDFEKALKGL